MQGGRSNVGSKTVPMGNKLATRMSGGGQPQPVATRPRAATPNLPAGGTRVLVNVDSAGLIQAGQQPVQQPQPPSPAQREVYPGQR